MGEAVPCLPGHSRQHQVIDQRKEHRMYLQKLFHDTLAANSQASVEAQHSFIYVWEGSAIINGEAAEEDSAVYAEDIVAVQAGGSGATLLRWELAPKDDPAHLLTGDGVSSKLRMSRRIKMFELVPTSRWLFRLDRVREAQGSTGLHSHPGSGIRCILSTNGECRIQSEKGEESVSSKPGDAWYEEGAYPVNFTSPPGVKSSFLRGIVFPPEFERCPDTVIWIEGQRKSGGGDASKFLKHYLQRVVKLR
jgi:hypothetical protein